MYDRAHDGLTQGTPYVLGCLLGLTATAILIALVVLTLDTLIGTIENTIRAHRHRRDFTRSGRKPTR